MKKLLSLFRRPSPLEQARSELADAERQLLTAQSAVDYAQALVSYHGQRVRRLRLTLRDITLEATNEPETRQPL